MTLLILYYRLHVWSRSVYSWECRDPNVTRPLDPTEPGCWLLGGSSLRTQFYHLLVTITVYCGEGDNTALEAEKDGNMMPLRAAAALCPNLDHLVLVSWWPSVWCVWCDPPPRCQYLYFSGYFHTLTQSTRSGHSWRGRDEENTSCIYQLHLTLFSPS